MTTLVKELFERIGSLNDKDRLELDRLLSRKLEQDWQAEAKKARRIARKRGLTMADIDHAIERRRYKS